MWKGLWNGNKIHLVLLCTFANAPQDGFPQVADKDIVLYIHRVDRVHRLYLQSSELGLPNPLTRPARSRVCFPFPILW